MVPVVCESEGVKCGSLRVQVTHTIFFFAKIPNIFFPSS